MTEKPVDDEDAASDPDTRRADRRPERTFQVDLKRPAKSPLEFINQRMAKLSARKPKPGKKSDK